MAFTYEALAASDFPADTDWLAPRRDLRVERLDARTVRFTLGRPWAGFLAAASLGVVPRRPLEGTSGGRWLAHPFNVEPVGAGP